MEITDIKKCKRAKGRYNIYLNQKFGFSLAEEVLAEEGLEKGQVLKKEYVEKIKASDEKRKALNTAFRLLSYRGRSRKEIEDKLKEKEYSKEAIGYVISKLESYHYIDDSKFINNWIKSRKGSRGKYLLKQELIKKGLDRSDVEDELQKITTQDEVRTACELIDKKEKYKELRSKEEIYQKIGGYLKRKGFPYDVIKEVIDEKTKKSP